MVYSLAISGEQHVQNAWSNRSSTCPKIVRNHWCVAHNFSRPRQSHLIITMLLLFAPNAILASGDGCRSCDPTVCIDRRMRAPLWPRDGGRVSSGVLPHQRCRKLSNVQANGCAEAHKMQTFSRESSHSYACLVTCSGHCCHT